ncbi:hypothetical protein SELMODRAFT_443602 [Selaginella moellendorffii]|uniref:tRNA-dihydrouridine(16/17) synthase [NAD(P)(+)] n=1 Tax=Selaginella moellendorffii TaxID=88036 RepID=D8S2T4_SELML|nr:tRNA-dihydrouridine(16/17) synthase [NAD(P)(+)]-like isoform X2 [Selaginella moellendorffii]EFJ21146.1 hypothetical protein SELMODRAFT_443602 [Selaginella moellendorffii]|eukprot:XP_002977808.1 tRNA-dihydrouridine(16/17) synthase [NAD(P)(+)]-like isoform X2 [Selaginella moellendorffii]
MAVAAAQAPLQINGFHCAAAEPDLEAELPLNSFSLSRHIERSWDHWRRIGAPKFMVAPMVDQSELPFRMLCRKYGATGAYTPMLHARLFSEDRKYRNYEFTTCPEDRPLLIQFCANNPDTLLAAAKLVEPFCDYIDINLGCPQRIAKRGNYGAFLMDDLPLVQALVTKLVSNLDVPVSCKIRMFPSLDDTISYAKMLESSGCSLLAVHGRTREQKCSRTVRADWEVIRAVKQALRIPVLANGNIRWLEDAERCIQETGVDGVLSAESLLENPALFAGYRTFKPSDSEDEEQGSSKLMIDPVTLLMEYLDQCEKYPAPDKCIRAHVHRLLGEWFRVHPDLREKLNREHKVDSTWLRDLGREMLERMRPKLGEVAEEASD